MNRISGHPEPNRKNHTIRFFSVLLPFANRMFGSAYGLWFFANGSQKEPHFRLFSKDSDSGTNSADKDNFNQCVSVKI